MSERRIIEELKTRVAELEKRNETLRAEAIKYRTLFHAFPHGISISDENGDIVETNAVAEVLLGVPKAEHEARTIDGSQWRIIRPDGTEMPAAEWASVLALKENRTVSDCEMGISKLDGRVTWLSVTATPLPLRGHGVVVTYSDITEKKASERQLRESKRRLKKSQVELRRTLEATTDGIWTWDFKTNELHFSPRYYKMLGYDPDEFPADFDHWAKLIHPEDLPHAISVAEEYLKTKPDHYENEFRLRTRHGEYRWIRTRARVVERDRNGQAVYMIGNHEDITDRKKTEVQLKENETKFRTLFEQAAVGVAQVSPVGDFLAVNNKFCEIIGYSVEELHRMNFRDITHPDDIRIDESQIARVIAGETDHFEIEKRYIHKSGRHVWIKLYSNVVRNENGDIKYAIAVVIDITDQKLLETKLRQAQKMESIGNLAGGIAHDFNNILFPIIGLSEMLLEDLPAGGIERENAMEIFKAGRRGGDLVKQILAFSRQSEHEMFPTRVQPILKEVLKLSRATIPSNIRIDQDIQSDCGLILADPTQIHQVAMNIITNAYHAVEAEGGDISIQLKEMRLTPGNPSENELAPGKYAVLTISDTGHGIPAELIGKIFDPYFTTKAQGKGTGLGLAVVYGIIKEHKGDIFVRSEVGKGTRFDIYLPLMKQKVGKASAPATADDRKGNERILLVDDEKPIALLEKQMLRRLGYTVTECTDSLEALQTFKANADSFDLVISDMTMPHMTGDRLAKELRMIRSDIPVIICTGFSENMNRETANAMGIQGFLMKPIVRSQLADMVREVLDKTTSATQRPSTAMAGHH